MKNPIIDYIKKHNLTKKELAKRCDVTVYILNRVINRTGGKASHLLKICKATGLKSDSILGIKIRKKGYTPFPLVKS